jgi:hypothetical protein
VLCLCKTTGWNISVFVRPEDGGNRRIWNVGKTLLDYMAQIWWCCSFGLNRHGDWLVEANVSEWSDDFNSEDGDSTLLQNVGFCQPIHTVIQPRKNIIRISTAVKISKLKHGTTSQKTVRFEVLTAVKIEAVCLSETSVSTGRYSLKDQHWQWGTFRLSQQIGWISKDEADGHLEENEKRENRKG